MYGKGEGLCLCKSRECGVEDRIRASVRLARKARAWGGAGAGVSSKSGSWELGVGNWVRASARPGQAPVLVPVPVLATVPVLSAGAMSWE